MESKSSLFYIKNDEPTVSVYDMTYKDEGETKTFVFNFKERVPSQNIEQDILDKCKDKGYTADPLD
jgi:hypothetical protein